MPQLDSPEIRELILDRLKHDAKMDDILVEVCEKTNIPWEKARVFIEKISTENRDDITLHRSPIIIMLSLALFIGGVFLLGRAVYAVYDAYMFGNEAFVFVLAFAGKDLFWGVVMGGGMIAGGVKGMEGIWEAILKKTGIL